MKLIRLRLLSFFMLSLLLVQAAESQPTEKITPTNALQHYLHNGDTTYSWKLVDTYAVGEVKAFVLVFKSQKWRNITWTHQLTVFVPRQVKFEGALLFITGASNKNGQPELIGHDDKLLVGISSLAAKNSAVVAVLMQTPNQPLFGNLDEDALISYTLHQFSKDKDYSWPLLFPMVKSAVRAMDAVQHFCAQSLNQKISRFVISGESKRGWTTWLTGANDPRVMAIAPMVIDVLNMGINLDYQLSAWHKYSIQIKDYADLGVLQSRHTSSGEAILQMVDPYSYRTKLTMPKLITIGTNDEYWVIDAIKNYYDSIPGRNLLHYIPNVGHSLGDKKDEFTSLSAFFGLTLAGAPYPVCDWSITTENKKAKLAVKTSANMLHDAVLWTAHSGTMDFTGSEWTHRSLGAKNKPTVEVEQLLPSSGFNAFYMDLIYMDPNGGSFHESTRMFVADENGIKLH